MKIAVLGLGRMGRAVAGRLIEGGHELVVWNRTPGKAPELLERGARQADSAASAVSGVDIAMTSLANDDAVRQIAFGDIVSSLGDDALYVDLSTISPALSTELDGTFRRFAAMPILGSPVAVAGGQAVYLLGAQPLAATLLDPVLPCLSDKGLSDKGLSDKVRRYDSPPLASTAKLAVNLLLLDGLVALAESVTVGRSGGLSDDQLRELLGDSPMVAPGLMNRFEGILTGSQEPWWTTILGAKDAGLATAVVTDAGGDVPLTTTAHDLYLKTASAGFPDADIAAVIHLYRSGNGGL